MCKEFKGYKDDLLGYKCEGGCINIGSLYFGNRTALFSGKPEEQIGFQYADIEGDEPTFSMTKGAG